MIHHLINSSCMTHLICGCDRFEVKAFEGDHIPDWEEVEAHRKSVCNNAFATLYENQDPISGSLTVLGRINNKGKWRTV